MTLMLALFSVLLVGLLSWQWQQPMIIGGVKQQDLPVEAGAKDRSRESPVQPFIAPPLTSFNEITERPLFTEGRLPPEKPAEEVAVKIPVTPLRLSLEGVVITPQSRIAVITDLQTNELLRLAEGMSHSDWKVTKVEKDTVTITRGKQETILALQPEEEPAVGREPKLKLPYHAPKRRPPPIIPGR